MELVIARKRTKIVLSSIIEKSILLVFSKVDFSTTVEMTKRSSFCVSTILTIIVLISINPIKHIHAQNSQSTNYYGDYLGKKLPGLIAEEFDSGQLTGDKQSFNFSFSPDGSELFFSYYHKLTEERPYPEYEIKYMKRVDNVWHGPETAFFSGTNSDVDITFSPL